MSDIPWPGHLPQDVIDAQRLPNNDDAVEQFFLAQIEAEKKGQGRAEVIGAIYREMHRRLGR